MRGGRVSEKGRGKRRSMWLSECGGGKGRGCLLDCDVSESTKKEERKQQHGWTQLSKVQEAALQ
jgi:hypothetical protein